MKILLEGCLYELESVHGTEIQAVKFITTTPSVDNPKKLIMINDGTTNEELIRVLIHRLEWQNRKLACMETQHAMFYLPTVRLLRDVFLPSLLLRRGAGGEVV
jgi:hypothetical protein